MRSFQTKAFTIIELLIVISLIGILAGILVSVLNPAAQRAKATDGVRVSNVEKVAHAIEGFYNAEGKYPAGSGNPLSGPDGTLLAAYIKTWPSDAVYVYGVADDGKNFVVYTNSATVPTGYIKYYSSWDKVQPCYAGSDAAVNADCHTTATATVTATATITKVPTATQTPMPPITGTPIPNCGTVDCKGPEFCCVDTLSCSYKGKCPLDGGAL